MHRLVGYLAAGVLALALPTSLLAGEKVSYSSGSESFEGYSSAAKGNSKGLVLVIHDGDGLTAYGEKRVNMLAEWEYDAFAGDLCGKGNRPVETGAKKLKRTSHIRIAKECAA